jgi:hypothetical protein
MTDLNTSDPGGVEQFHFSMGKATNYLAPYLKEKQEMLL